MKSKYKIALHLNNDKLFGCHKDGDGRCICVFGL